KSVALVKAFSLRKNLRTLLNTDSNQHDISCLHGIRALNAFALLVFHKFLVLCFTPFINKTYGAECLPQTHQLAMDMQLFIVSPVFIYLLWRSRRLGMIVIAAAAAASTLLRYYVIYSKRLTIIIYNGVSLTQLYASGNLTYVLPTHRLTIYLMGVVVGYLMHRTNGRIVLSKIQVWLGWTAAIFLALLAVFGLYRGAFPDYRYEPHEHALYGALAPIMWGGYIFWTIYSSWAGYGGIYLFMYAAGVFGALLSWKWFRVFSRVTYSLYLVQFLVYFYNAGVRRTCTTLQPATD
ncbi:hypothetical protein ANN_13391, partial [Periplaneta americana]